MVLYFYTYSVFINLFSVDQQTSQLTMALCVFFSSILCITLKKLDLQDLSCHKMFTRELRYTSLSLVSVLH